MMHKSEDYKISAVKYYLKNKDNIRKTCKILEFLQKYIFPIYKDHLIILDNAGSHNNELIKNAITKSGNKTKIYTLCEGQTLLIFNGFLSHFKSSRV